MAMFLVTLAFQWILLYVLAVCHHQLMTDAIKLHLPHAKHRMKRRADKGRFERQGCF